MKPQDFLKEDIVTDAAEMHHDHEVQMARQQCYFAAKDAIRIHSLLKNVSEMEGIEGWMQSKLSKAADYLKAVAESLEYDHIEKQQDNVVAVPDAPADAFNESRAEELYSKLLDETTSAGAVAAVAMPMGDVVKRKKKKEQK